MKGERIVGWTSALMAIFLIVTFGYRIEKLTEWSGVGYLAALMVIIIIAVNILLAFWITDEITKKIESKGGEDERKV